MSDWLHNLPVPWMALAGIENRQQPAQRLAEVSVDAVERKPIFNACKYNSTIVEAFP
jgi:hypothetical protein